MKNRVDLAKYFNSLGFKIGAEIGVSEGINARNMCLNIPGLKLYCVDLWDGGRGERALVKAKERLAGFDVIFIRKSSMDALADFADNSLDFVFIDANHSFDFVMQDIIGWVKKVKPGGIVSGHDYYHSKSGTMGVIEAVDAYTLAHHIKFNLTTKDAMSKDDKEPSFWWIKA